MDMMQIITLLIGGGGIITSGWMAFLNRKKTGSEVRHSEIDAEQKIKEYEKKDRLNAYQERAELQKKYDDLLEKVTNMAEERAIRIEEREQERIWRKRTDQKIQELQDMYESCRCDKWACKDRIPPLKKKYNGEEEI